MKKLWTYLEENIEELLMVLLLIVMSLVMIVQVVLRMMDHGLTWAEELCRYCFVYSGMISAGYCIRKGVGIRVDALYNFFPRPMQIAVDYIGKILTTVVYGYLAYKSIGLIQTTTSISTAMQLPIKYVYAAVPLGLGLGAIRGVQDLVKFTKRLSEEKKEGKA
ncbi:MAG: TRAP transporter small permease [Oscillospiraceae bacterium]|nr:TRAP transporter small permease [Oscillospiraceae bacterium]